MRPKSTAWTAARTLSSRWHCGVIQREKHQTEAELSAQRPCKRADVRSFHLHRKWLRLTNWEMESTVDSYFFNTNSILVKSDGELRAQSVFLKWWVNQHSTLMSKEADKCFIKPLFTFDLFLWQKGIQAEIWKAELRFPVVCMCNISLSFKLFLYINTQQQ